MGQCEAHIKGTTRLAVFASPCQAVYPVGESMYYPDKSGFRAAADKGNVIPVFREIVADGDTPVSAYAKLAGRDYSFLLESVVGGEKWAEYSFIGAIPRAVLKCRGGVATATWYDVDGIQPPREASWSTTDPTAALAEVMSEWQPVEVPGLPRFWGGAVGWISYDAVRSFEDLPKGPSDDLSLPELCMVITDTLIIFDNLRQTVKVVTAPFVPRADRIDEIYDRALDRIDATIMALRSRTSSLPALAPPPVGERGTQDLRWGGGTSPTSSFAREDYCAAVEAIREYILAGDIFQAVLSQRLQIARDGLDPFHVYRALRVINPSPYMYHLQYGDVQVTGASPETLVRCEHGQVEVRPIAGTRPRGATPRLDDELACELLADAKECAEHLMLVDLGRNDVGRVAKIGSVAVPEYMSIERYSHVMHMVSRVTGELLPNRNWRDVLRASFPAGTLSGAPKIRAMEIIDELEPVRRGIYGGAVGYVSFSGNLDLAIAIRTLVTCGDNIYVQAGAGIVHDSNSELEYEECVNKARAALRAVALARSAKDTP